MDIVASMRTLSPFTLWILTEVVSLVSDVTVVTVTVSAALP